jgi:hypothetical protein
MQGNILRGHFFYSAQQARVRNENGRRRLFAKLDDDRIVEYTEMNDADKPYSQFGDVIYLGYGEYSHSKPY